jgi:hypothetical protein
LTRKTQKQPSTEISGKKPICHRKKIETPSKAASKLSEQEQKFWKGLFSAIQLAMERLTDWSKPRNRTANQR